ncbi:hypothetical protein [Psychromicrobium lacuslunae]|uniref:Cardiolipin synthase N-terminal domain-containing protein n=1 Tax=Psychromicrobium lacuslunae TaxID=1618207 RepID=A0A0D4BWM0_9MICC|nr:hypothetical protein [Psychromicrobium lacuslunae]AJT40496.1 hypothetical protein UM93_01165 [Psychromicrobium lacuslunae]
MLQAASSSDSLGKIAHLGGLAGVGLVATIGIAIALVTVILIGMVGVLAQYQTGRLRGRSAICWGLLVIALPVLGTLLWSLTTGGRGRQFKAPRAAEVIERVETVESRLADRASNKTSALSSATQSLAAQSLVTPSLAKPALPTPMSDTARHSGLSRATLVTGR